MKKVEIIRELKRVAKNLVALEFDTKEEMEKYKKEHKVRKDTKLTVKQPKKKKPSKKTEETPKITTKKKFDMEEWDSEGYEAFCKKLLNSWCTDEEKYEARREYSSATDYWGNVFNGFYEGGILPEMGYKFENGRIRSDGKVSFTYDGYAPGADMDFGCFNRHEIFEIFKGTNEYQDFQRNNPGLKIEMIKYDMEIDCTNEDGAINEEASKELFGLYEKFGENVRFVDTFEVKGQAQSCICDYLGGKVEINCDDLYGDCQIHESPNGKKYFLTGEASKKDSSEAKDKVEQPHPQESKSKGFDINKLSPELREKLKDMDEEDIKAFIGWLKNRKNGGGSSDPEDEE